MAVACFFGRSNGDGWIEGRKPAGRTAIEGMEERARRQRRVERKMQEDAGGNRKKSRGRVISSVP